jgi:hypothetical protein
MSENLIERYLTDMGEVRALRLNVPEDLLLSGIGAPCSDVGRTFLLSAASSTCQLKPGCPTVPYSLPISFVARHETDARENPFLIERRAA